MTVASTPRGHDNVGPLAKRTNGCATASRQVFEDLFRLAQVLFYSHWGQHAMNARCLQFTFNCKTRTFRAMDDENRRL